MIEIGTLAGGPLDGETIVIFNSSHILFLLTPSQRIAEYQLRSHNEQVFDYKGYRIDVKLSDVVPYEVYRSCVNVSKKKDHPI